MTYYEQLQAMAANPPDECVLWASCRSDGYVIIKIAGLQYRAHMVACALANGPRPEGKQAAHSCGRPNCVNPAHVRWATPIENAADKVQHGTRLLGSAVGGSKLTAEQVQEIRRQAPLVTHRSLAHAFGVSPAQISQIVHRKRWTWLPDPAAPAA